MSGRLRIDFIISTTCSPIYHIEGSPDPRSDSLFTKAETGSS